MKRIHRNVRTDNEIKPKRQFKSKSAITENNNTENLIQYFH